MTKTNNMDDASEVVKQIREGDKTGIKAFLAGGGDPITRNHMGFTVLHLAALEGQTEIAEMLLNAGATVNCCTTDMCTPLHLASGRGNIKAVQVLVKNGAYVNAQDKGGNTPLHEAARLFHTPVVKFLIEKKADVRKVNKKNQTFIDLIGQQMMPTVESGDIDVLLDWLSWGLSANTFGNLNWSILHHASARGQINIVSLLIESGADVNCIDSNRGTALHAAAFHGHKKIAEVLLASGASINAQDQRGNTPLHSALSGAHPELITLLLEKGCDTTMPNKEGQMFTHLVNEFLIEAIVNNRIAHVTSLLKGRADPDTKDAYGSPVLCCAAFKGDILMVTALLEAGAKPNNCSEDTLKTSLHYASCLGHFFVVKALLDKGASVTVKDKNGLTPLHEAVREGAEDLATVLIGRGAPLNEQDGEGNTPLHVAARWGQSAIVEMLLEKGANEDVKNKSGMLYSDLALMRAVRTENASHVVSSLAWGGNPNVQDSKGWTFLHHAVYKNAYEVCYVLLENEAEVNIADKHGKTPLLLAAYRGDRQIMEMLLNAGANPNVQDKEGQTPLHWAAEEGSIDTVEVLLARGAQRNIKNKKGLLFSDLLLKHLYFAVRHNDESKVESLLIAGADQSAELKGTGVTPREEAKRRKYYPILKKMVALAPAKPRLKQTKEDFVPLEDVRKLFEDSEEEESSSESSSESEEEYDPDEDAYWRMHNAPVVLSAKDLFEDEEKSFWENWEEKPVIISAKDAFKEKVEWWKNSSSSSDDSSSDESDIEPIPTFEETKKKWGKVISAKEFFREDECWWRDAEEDLDKKKAITAKEFFKDEVAWWERSSSDEENDEIPREERNSQQKNEEDEISVYEDIEERNSQQKNEEDEVSVYEDIEESLTDDWETANDSVLSDTGTMYSASEGDRIMAEDLFAPTPWWESENETLDSTNMDDSSSAEDELTEDKSEKSEETVIDDDSSCIERANFSTRRKILSSTESDASTNLILEDNEDNESVENVFDLENDECIESSNIHCSEDKSIPSGDIDICAVKTNNNISETTIPVSEKSVIVTPQNKEDVLSKINTDVSDETKHDNEMFPTNKFINNTIQMKNKHTKKLSNNLINKDIESNFPIHQNVASESSPKMEPLSSKENAISREEILRSRAGVKIVNHTVSNSRENTNKRLNNASEDNICQNLLQIVLDNDAVPNSPIPLDKNNTDYTSEKGIIQTPSLKFKIKDFKPVNSDLKPHGMKCVDEKMVTLRNPVLNKMDACLAKVDASLAWLDERMAGDSIPGKRNSKRKIQPKYSAPSTVNNSSKESSTTRKGKSPERLEEPDSFQIFRIKIRVPEQNTLKFFDNYIEKDSTNVPKSDKLKSSISENTLFGAKDVNSYKLTEAACDTMHKCNSIAKLESVNSVDKDHSSELSQPIISSEERTNVRSNSLDTLLESTQQSFPVTDSLRKSKAESNVLDTRREKELLTTASGSLTILCDAQSLPESKPSLDSQCLHNSTGTLKDTLVSKGANNERCLNSGNKGMSILDTSHICTTSQADIVQSNPVNEIHTSVDSSSKNCSVTCGITTAISVDKESHLKERKESKSTSAVSDTLSSANSACLTSSSNQCVSGYCEGRAITNPQNNSSSSADNVSCIENHRGHSINTLKNEVVTSSSTGPTLIENATLDKVDTTNLKKNENENKIADIESLNPKSFHLPKHTDKKKSKAQKILNNNEITSEEQNISIKNTDAIIPNAQILSSETDNIKSDAQTMSSSVYTMSYGNENKDITNLTRSSDVGNVRENSNGIDKCEDMKTDKGSLIHVSSQEHNFKEDTSLINTSTFSNDNMTDSDSSDMFLSNEQKKENTNVIPKIHQDPRVTNMQECPSSVSEETTSTNLTEDENNSKATTNHETKKRTKWRWSAFEPRTMNEYDNETDSLLTCPHSKSSLRRSMSDNSLSDISNNEGDTGGQHDTQKFSNEHLEFLLHTNRFGAVPNTGMKPPIPPRRNRDNRQSVNNQFEKYDASKFCTRDADINNKLLSYNPDQKQTNELKASSLPIRLKRKKKDFDASRDHNFVERDACQAPKVHCMRAQRQQDEHVINNGRERMHEFLRAKKNHDKGMERNPYSEEAEKRRHLQRII